MIIHYENKLNNFYKHKKLNVAIVTDGFFPQIGGVENVVSSLCNAFYKNQLVNVVCITGEVKGTTDIEDFSIIRTKSIKIPKKWGLNQPVPEFDHKFKKLLNKLKIDVFHIHTVYGIASYCLKYAKKHNIPVIFHGHSKFNQEIPTVIKSKLIAKIVYRRAYKFVNKCNYVISVSNATKQNYIENGVKTPISTIANTTNMPLNTNEKEILNYFEKTYNLTKNQPILLFVGRLEMKCKNLDFLFNSLKILKDKNFNFKMLIVGGGNDEEKLKDLAKNLNIFDNLIFVGKIVDATIISKFYYFADLFCFPSIVDTAGIVKFEAASQKTPSLVIKNSASQEDVIDNFNGYYCELNENEYANKIIEIFNNKQNLNEISINAFNTLNLGWDKVSKQIFEIYKNLTNKV